MECAKFRDLSELLKSGISLQEVYKKTFNSACEKTVEFATARGRKTISKNRRETKGNFLLNKRNIPRDMSPFNTPAPSVKKVQKTSTRPEKSEVEKRLEKLAKWRELKKQEKEKALQEKLLKPAFKFCHAPQEAGLPDLDMVNKVIKGKLIKFQKHKFKPPSNITAIALDKPQSPKKQPRRQLKFEAKVTAPNTPRVTTRSQVQKLKQTDAAVSKPNAKGVSPRKRKNVASSTASTSSEHLTKRTRHTDSEPVVPKNTQKTPKAKQEKKPVAKTPSSKPKKSPVKLVVTQKTPKGKNEKKPVVKTPSSKPKKSPVKLVVTPNTPKAKNEKKPVVKTPSNKLKKSPVKLAVKSEPRRKVSSTPMDNPVPVLTPFVSPFVLVSRGKENARKEFEKRTPLSSKSLDLGAARFPAATPEGPRRSVGSYVSPFVTISRGKESARKEFECRSSSGGSFTPKSDFAKVTSPLAGAAYFLQILNEQIKRLERVCATWTSYKEEQNPSEDVCEMIDVAIGQSQLLINKKFQQFRGLIDRCTRTDDDMPVTCEDLHGFWDMVYIQVVNIDKRFANLERLKRNNWEEVLSAKKPTKKVQIKRKKATTATSSLRDAIRAAREKNKKTDPKVDAPRIEITQGGPVTSEPQQITTRRSSRRSLVQNVLLSNAKRRISSPGLNMMKVTQQAKHVADEEGRYTPVKSILKTSESVTKSSRRDVKAVLFDEVLKENDFNLMNLSKTPGESVNTPRRSSRLLKCKLF